MYMSIYLQGETPPQGILQKTKKNRHPHGQRCSRINKLHMNIKLKCNKTAEPHGPAEINFQKQKLLVSTYRAKRRRRIFFEKQKRAAYPPGLAAHALSKISIRKIKT